MPIYDTQNEPETQIPFLETPCIVLSLGRSSFICPPPGHTSGPWPGRPPPAERQIGRQFVYLFWRLLV